MQTLKIRMKDTLYVTGLTAVLCSLIIFAVPLVLKTPVAVFNYFVVNYTIAVIYFITLLVTGRLRRGRDGLAPLFLLLILLLISAYSLNRELNVFESSVDWLSVTLVLVSVNYVAFAFFEVMPRIVKHLMCFMLGLSVCLFAYLSIYLIPLYLVSAAGFFLLGISLHSFVPLLFFLFSIRLFRRATAKSDLKLSFYAGTASVATLLVLFVAVWSNTTSEVNKTYRYATANNDDLPAWVTVAQTTAGNVWTEKLFKTALVYAVPGNTDNNFLWRMPARNFDEQKKHDPLVMTASFLAGPLALEESDRIKILESQYDSRHLAQERLWSGESLQTSYVNTNVRIWPRFSIAYTEKTITVSNLNNSNSSPSRGEAIYTFHLPEGGVVSALSLWINGKEEKGLLTTTEKAATAYRTIVGIESRDPSVVHWQEGNTVSVRVFPVVSGENRIFKIGITAPLQKSNNNLIYHNIYFDGPSSSGASEDVSVKFDRKPESLAEPALLSSEDERHYTRSGSYKADWSVDFAYEGLSPQGFGFNGKVYSLSPYRAERQAAILNNIYLDVNSSWTRREFEKVLNLAGNRNVFVFTSSLVRVTAGNKDRLFRELSSLHFSLFPIYEIKNASASLLVSKSTGASPDFNDLKESAFLRKTKEYIGSSARLKLFNMGSGLSPYLKTLLEYRAFNFEEGDTAVLEQLIKKSVFASDKEDGNHVVVHNAAFMITESTGTVSSLAPDHLMRLYAYNYIMKEAGKKLSGNVPEDEELVKIAKAASIVTPVSSLVVLETKEDYDRFKIQDSKDGLGNASLKSKGSVPEPHEWLLILTVLSVLAYLKFKPVVKLHRS